MSRPQFPAGGARICVPLVVADQTLGCMILADRVNGIPYSEEEFDLLNCMGDQLGASLLNLRLTDEVMVGKELEAFQTMSTFFVHDLKNAASTLTLMLRNLPVHFQDPAFREDALRGIGRTADRINQMISGPRIGIRRITSIQATIPSPEWWPRMRSISAAPQSRMNGVATRMMNSECMKSETARTGMADPFRR